MMPPPITSSRLQSSGNSSAPVESMTRGSSGNPGKRTDSDPAAMMHCLKSTRRTPSADLQLERVGSDEFRLAAHHVDLALLGEHGQAVGQLRDHLVLPGTQLVPIDLRRRENDAACRHVGGILDHLGGVQQRLGRNAADVQADAAEHRPALDQRDLEPEIGGAERRGVAAGTRAEHDQIERARRRAPLLAARPATGRSAGGAVPARGSCRACRSRVGSGGARAAGSAAVPALVRLGRAQPRRRAVPPSTVAMTVPADTSGPS